MRSARAAGKDEPLLPDRERPERSGSGRRSLLVSVFNVVNTTFGTGFFLYPKALVANGVGIGLAAVCALLALVVFSLHSLADAVGRSPASLTAYPETIGYFSRPWCARVISASIQIYLVGAGAAYLALFSDQAAVLWGSPPPRWVLLLGPTVLAVPFSLLRSMSAFAFTSAFGVLVNCVVVAVLSHGAAAKLWRDGVAPQQCDGDDSAPSAGAAFATLCSTVVFSFQCHSDAFIPNLRSLDFPTAAARRASASTVIHVSVLFCATIYVSFGVLKCVGVGMRRGRRPAERQSGGRRRHTARARTGLPKSAALVPAPLLRRSALPRPRRPLGRHHQAAARVALPLLHAALPPWLVGSCRGGAQDRFARRPRRRAGGHAPSLCVAGLALGGAPLLPRLPLR
uniref:Amino acid transporter transmembrane domain-containing protein n=1 Tax=Emiliania huxleyi TaxID=2903 RepID=A0A7S3U1P9_EMIHU